MCKIRLNSGSEYATFHHVFTLSPPRHVYIRLLLLCSLLVLLVVGPACAQDLLTKRNGDEVAVKVVEITPSELNDHGL